MVTIVASTMSAAVILFSILLVGASLSLKSFFEAFYAVAPGDSIVSVRQRLGDEVDVPGPYVANSPGGRLSVCRSTPAPCLVYLFRSNNFGYNAEALVVIHRQKGRVIEKLKVVEP